jgi:hypothetical protein
MRIEYYAMMVETRNGQTRIVPTVKDFGEWARKEDVEKLRKRLNFLEGKSDREPATPADQVPMRPAKPCGRPKATAPEPVVPDAPEAPKRKRRRPKKIVTGEPPK